MACGGGARGCASRGPTDSQDNLLNQRFLDLLIQHGSQSVPQHVQLVQPDRILDAEVQSPTPDVFNGRPFPNPGWNGTVPGPEEGEMPDRSTETQPLEG